MVDIHPGGPLISAEPEAGRPPDGTPTAPPAYPSRSGRRTVLRLLLLGLVILGFAAAALFDILAGRERAVDGAVRQTRNLALTLEMDAADVFRAADQAAGAAVNAVLLNQGTAALHRQIRGDGVVAGLAVAGPDGRILRAVADALPPATVEELGRAHLDSADDGPRISRPFRIEGGDGWRIAVSRRVGEAGTPSGFAAAVIDLRRFERFYASLDIGPLGMVTLWGRDGAVLARHPQDPQIARDPFAQAAMAPRFTSGTRELTLTGRSPLDGEERIATVNAVQGLPLAVSVRLGASDYLAGWRDTSWRRALETLVLTAVLALLATRLMRHLGRVEANARALRESERRFQALFDSTFQVMGLMAPDGRILALNQPACDLAGEPLEALIGRQAWTVAHWAPTPDVASQFRGSIEAAAAGRFVRYETAIDIGAGPRVLDVSIKPVRDEAGAVALLVAEARDITQRKAFEEELSASERRLRSYLDAAMEGFFISDSSGRFVDVNPAGCRMLGFSRDEVLERRVPDLIPADHPQGPASLAGFRSVPEGGVFRGEAVLTRKDGSIIMADVNAVQLDDGRFLGVIRDVTKRRLAEEALRASTSRLTALIGALPDLVLILDDEGRYREVIANGNESLLVGPAEDMVGHTMAERLPPATADQIMDALRLTLETDQPQRIEYSLTVQAGPRWFEGRTQRLSTDFAARPMVLLLTRDITDRVEAAERLAAAKEQAETAHRAKSTFLATMSHELRTPLNAIIGFSEIMLHELFGPIGSPRYRDYARHIQISGRHLLDLINDVLDMSKLEAGHYMLEEAWVEVPETLSACAALSAAAVETGEIALSVSAREDLPLVLADERALRQVVLNLLSNAVKFTPAGGRVTVEAGVRDDGAFAIAVSDTGIGIPAEALDRIAQPFQQADSSINRRFGGSGLGLSISRNLIELHGGTLEIASVEGEGTTVTITLPAERVGGRGVK